MGTHTDCAPGQWYNRQGRAQFGDRAAFKAIEQPHVQFHQQLKEVVAACNRGDRTAGKKGIQEISQLSQEIVANLTRIENSSGADSLA
ncbi:MAG: hypothetical protein GYA17_06975 [Chloroflexi bacterium]|nr:hypothetical protein [Chloroflexota bacterium]